MGLREPCFGINLRKHTPRDRPVRNISSATFCGNINHSDFEPPHDIQNDCAPSEDSAQPGPFALSDQSLHCALNGYLRTQAVFMRTVKTDQTGQMPRLI